MLKKTFFYGFLVFINVFTVVCLLIASKRFLHPMYVDNVSDSTHTTPQKELTLLKDNGISDGDLYQYEERPDPDYMKMDDKGSWGHKPNLTSEAVFINKDGKEINADNKVIYTINNFGFREHKKSSKEKKKTFSAFLGCSFVFGVAVQDNETLPAFMEKINPETQGYNFGVSGYGTNQVLHQALNTDLKSIIKEETGDFFLIKIPQHTYRSYPHSSKIWQGREDTPVYSKNSNGYAQYLGPYQKVKPLSYAIDNFLHWTGLADLELTSRELQDYECDLIELLDKETKSMFPKSRFHVVYHPQYSDYFKYLKQCLIDKKISLIEFPEYSDQFSKQLAIDHSHPSALSNEALIELITEHFKAKK